MDAEDKEITLIMFNLSTEIKVIIIGGIVTILVIVGVSLLLASSSTSVPDDQIVAKNGLHWHPQLIITIDGKRQEIPANVGIGTIHQKIHTHDTDAKDGVIHMEMSGIVVKEDTRLGNFFRIWGKELSSTTIFDKKNGEEGKVKMVVNGKENTDFENYLMKDGDGIEIKYE